MGGCAIVLNIYEKGPFVTIFQQVLCSHWYQAIVDSIMHTLLLLYIRDGNVNIETMVNKRMCL